MHPSYHGSRRQSKRAFPVRDASSEEILMGKGRSSGSGDPHCFGDRLDGSCLSENLDAPTNKPGDRHVDAMEVFLDPGDILYIPPFHFHSKIVHVFDSFMGKITFLSVK